MYKTLLCWRYLKTRYLALACIISVMLGVATLIVVNSVMNGFSTKLRDRLHGLCSDVLIEAVSLDGFSDPRGKMMAILSVPELAEAIEAMSPTLEIFAMMQFRFGSETITRTVRLIGVEPESRTALGGFSKFLVLQKDAEKPSFEVSERAKQHYQWRLKQMEQPKLKGASQLDPPIGKGASLLPPGDPVQMGTEPPPPVDWDRETKLPRGVVIGNLLASYKEKDPNNPGAYEEVYVLHPGDSIIVTTVSGARMAPVYDSFIVVDYFKSEMSEYDGNSVFVPLDYLQFIRTMEDRVTSIQIKLKDSNNSAKAKLVVERLQKMFPERGTMRIVTWEEKQGPILAAISIERGILNVLLFLIVGVAGFGILAIFSMIVAEKTKDIGILKALGASNGGVMKIFLSYGFLLGLIGTLVGTGLGIWLTNNINEVEQWLSKVTGQEVFRRDVYYFDKIPTDIQLWTVLLVNFGAVAIAVVFSVIPALRAASLHPVRALRYE